MDWLLDLLDRFVTDPDDLYAGRAKVAGISAGGEAGATAYLEACRLLGEAASDSAGLIAALDEIDEPTLVQRIGGVVITCFAALRATYPARPDAVAARAALVARADPVIELAGTAFGHELHGWLTNLTSTAVRELSALAATRAPLVRVETGVSLPAALIAWDLYGDPNRDGELVDRNESGTAFIMPVILEALAP